MLKLAWPQVGSDKQTLRPDTCGVSQFWWVTVDICCCLSGVLSPTVRCVSVAVGVATSRVGHTDIEARYVFFPNSECYGVLISLYPVPCLGICPKTRVSSVAKTAELSSFSMSRGAEIDKSIRRAAARCSL